MRRKSRRDERSSGRSSSVTEFDVPTEVIQGEVVVHVEA